MTHLRIGPAAVTLDGDECTLSVSYDLNEMLDRAARVAAVVLLEDDAKYAVDVLSALRRDLAARAGIGGQR